MRTVDVKCSCQHKIARRGPARLCQQLLLLASGPRREMTRGASLTRWTRNCRCDWASGISTLYRTAIRKHEITSYFIFSDIKSLDASFLFCIFFFIFPSFLDKTVATCTSIITTSLVSKCVVGNQHIPHWLHHRVCSVVISSILFIHAVVYDVRKPAAPNFPLTNGNARVLHQVLLPRNSTIENS